MRILIILVIFTMLHSLNFHEPVFQNNEIQYEVYHNLLQAFEIDKAQEGSKPVKTVIGGARSGSGKDTGAVMFPLSNFKKGEIKEIKLNMKSLPVHKISFKSKKNYIGNMEIYVKRTYDFATKTFPKLEDPHSYFEINTVNFNLERFEDYKIYFHIEKSWLLIRKLNHTNISLYRFSNQTWNELETNFTESEGNSFLYYAKTPGFSYFGISKARDINIAKPKPKNLTIDKHEVPEEVNLSYEGEIFEDYYDSPHGTIEEISNKWEETIIYWATLAILIVIFYGLKIYTKKS